MRQRLLIVALAAMAALSWYAVYRTVRFTIAVATDWTERPASPALPRGPRRRSCWIVTANRSCLLHGTSNRRTIDQVSPHMLHAVVAVEISASHRFTGLDPIRIIRAALRNVRAGRVVEGGSTITQQLARAARLSASPYVRKETARGDARAAAGRALFKGSHSPGVSERGVRFRRRFLRRRSGITRLFRQVGSGVGPGRVPHCWRALVEPRLATRHVPRSTRRRDVWPTRLLRLMEQQGFITTDERSDGVRAPLPEGSHTREPLLVAANGESGG